MPTMRVPSSWVCCMQLASAMVDKVDELRAALNITDQQQVSLTRPALIQAHSRVITEAMNTIIPSSALTSNMCRRPHVVLAVGHSRITLHQAHSLVGGLAAGSGVASGGGTRGEAHRRVLRCMRHERHVSA